MRKHNFLKSTLCLLLALVCHVAWAQPAGTYVTDLSQLDNAYTYTIKSARAFLLYSTNCPNEIATSTGSAVGSVTYNATDVNQQFRIEKRGSDYYLYSVGAGKYVGTNGAYTDEATTALNIANVGGDYPWKLQIGNQGMNTQIAGQSASGIMVNSWTGTDAGNRFMIEEAVVTAKTYTVSVLGANDGGVVYEGSTYANGQTFEATKLQKESLEASSIEGMFSIINIEGTTVYVSYFNDNTKFYTIRGGHGGYLSLGEGYTNGGNLLLSNTNVPKDNKALWAFVGNSTDGYKIYNYSTGRSKVLGMTGSETDARATMVAEGAEGYTTAFDGNIKFDGTDGRIKLKGSANNYWNKRGDYLALWADNAAAGNDTGSKFYLDEADHVSIPDEYIHEISEIAGINNFTPKNPNTLWYKTSAEASGVSYPWMEYALPLGNGELGCMVFGGVAHEELQFNEKTLWSGPANTVGAGGGNRTFMNFGSLIIANNDASIYTEGVTDYVRYLDIEEGIAGVSFKNANGTKQTRKYLSSAPDQVIAGQYKSEGDDKLNLTFSLEPGNSIGASAVTYEGNTASFSGKMTVEYAARLHVVANEGAKVTATKAGIKVENATEVTFYLKGATNFDGNMKNTTSYFTSEDAAAVNTRIEADIEKAEAKGFDAIEKDHVEDFTAITKRMTLSLGLTTPTVDTKTLIDNYYPNNGDANSTANDHLFLEQLYFHYGRYLAISSNRKDIAAPNNLQGIWNDRGTDSPWNSDIHTNINIQMNYWPTEITNLSDLHKPFVNFIIRGAQSEGWKEVGNRYNNGHGWSVLTETSLYNSMSTWGDNYLVANVWYTSHLWMHYRYTQDKEFLKEAFPAMWGAAEFWFHRLIEDRGFDNTQDEQEHVRNYHTPYKFEPDGTFVAPNEFSAEQHDNQTEDGTAHAQQMIYYLFTNIKEAIDILGGKEAVGLTDADIEKLNLYLEKTDQGLHTETYTGAWGETYNGVKTGDPLLREWKYTPFDISNDRGHRHMSHMMALFPMDQITPESEYFTPAVNSLKLRGDAATGWSMGWKVNLWARAQDGDHAHIIIKNALKHSTDYGTNAGAGGIYYNLFDSHAPFQIDGNFGVCSGIAEMLLQSAHGYINILPALPKVWEAKGTITGMKAIGNFTVDFNWQDGKAQQVTIVSNAGAPLKVRSARGNIATALITVNGTEVTAEVDENGIATIPCKKGQTVVIDFTQEATPNAKPVDGYYLMYSESSSGKGWVHYNGSLSGRKYRVATDVNLSTEVTTEQAQYIWKLVNDSENGTFTLWNLGGNVYMPADASRNANMGATTPANLAIEAVEGEGNEGKWFVSQTNYTNNGNTLYIHTNEPGGYPNLSYWDSKSVNGTSIRAQFTKVDLLESTYTINYMCGEEIVASTEVSYPTGLAVPEMLLQRDVPAGYLVQGDATLSGTTYTINVVSDILPEAGEYIRIGYDFGTAGVKYLQSTNSSVKGLAMTADKGEGSIFLVEEIDGNLRLKSISTGKYLKEDGSNRGLYDTGGNVTFTVGTDGKIKIQAPSYLHANNSDDNYFIDHCGNDGCAQHNLIVEEVKVRSLTVEGPAYVGASATWNGETKALPATWAIFDGITITDPALSINCPASYTFTGFAEGNTSLGNTVEIASLTTNRTITANFNMAFFSASTDAEDLVPVRIRSARNTTYTLRLNANDNYTGKAVNSGVTAYGENELWYLVGTKESFKIYNRVAGTGLHIVLAGTGEGSAASMNTTANNADFCLVAKDNGYAICPKANTGQSFNMHGGAGADIKLYGAGDGGSIWLIEKMDVTKPLTLNVEVDQVWESSPRVAELTLTIDGLAGQTRVLGDVAGQKLYIPAGAAYEVSSMTYRGYTYNGCTEEDGVLTASYTANDERTLFYSPRDGHPYRIPAIATAPNGDIFAICDYRPCGNDIGYGEVDLVCRVSSDNGVTWTEERTIADGLGDAYAVGDTTKIWQVGFGDPAIVADRESNKVLVMSVCGNQTCWDGTFGDPDPNPNRVARLYITYNEDTKEWVYGEPEEVTYDIYRLFENKNGGEAYAASMFIGAGKICQSRVVKKGEYYRLYCAVWNVTKTQRQHHNYVIYSDDFGQTWNVLGDLGYENSASKWGNEPKVEELPDGTVVLSSRKNYGRYFNLFTFADDTYTKGSWMGEVGSNEVQDGLSFGGNSTNGEIYKVKAIHKESGRICDLMFQSIPTGNDRSNVAIYYKEMEYNEDGTNKYTSTTFAQGWTKGIHVSTKGSCYSTMISQADGRIAFFFEEEPSGYCMVYIPYTIEELTGGAYTLYTVNSTIGQYEIGTFYASEAVVIPEGVQAYVATEEPVMENGTGVITMTELEGIIPAHTGAVLRGAADTYKFIPSISYGAAVEGNMLVGFEAADNKADSKKAVTVAEDYTTYVLTVQNEKAGFYRKEKGTFDVFNNKAYLDLSTSAEGVSTLAIRFDGDGTTDIEASTLNPQPSTEVYDLQGRRALNPTKGVYIVNGKKVVIK